jgi:hypothetical protein
MTTASLAGVIFARWPKTDDELEGPFIRTTEAEHRYLTKDEVCGSGHPPDSFVAMALA